MNTEQIKLFEAFLKRKRAHKKFFKNQTNTGIRLTTLYSNEFEEVILGAFDWEASPEGQCYWENMSDAWIEYTRTLN